LDEFKEKEGVQMAKFFNKEYILAYERNKMVWVKGSIANHPYHRMSTGKKFSRANMNWAEKNWEQILRDNFERKASMYDREKIPTLDEYAMVSFAMNEGSRKFYTTNRYKSLYVNHIAPVLGAKKLDEIKVRDIKYWYTHLVKTINAHEYASSVKIVLSGILRDAMEDELIDKNVVGSVRFPKKSAFKNEGTVKIDPFTLDEVRTLIDNATGFFRNIIIFQFFTGIRPGEMIALRWEDVNFNSDKITICRQRQDEKNPDSGECELGPTKTGTTRRIDMLPIVKDALKEQYKLTGLKDGFVFLSTNGEPYMDHEGLAKRQWKTLLKRCLMDYRNFYQTRHTFASIFLSEGEELAWVSNVMLGHKNIGTTLKYYATFIKKRDVTRGAFLNNERTQSVHENNLLAQSS
jgi:integrase